MGRNCAYIIIVFVAQKDTTKHDGAKPPPGAQSEQVVPLGIYVTTCVVCVCMCVHACVCVHVRACVWYVRSCTVNMSEYIGLVLKMCTKWYGTYEKAILKPTCTMTSYMICTVPL